MDFLILFEVLGLFAFFLRYFCLKNKLAYIKEYYLKHVLFAVSKYLTLLIEIHPINNVRVLKAVDSCVRVQFLYPVEGRNASRESRLLLVSEDKCELIFSKYIVILLLQDDCHSLYFW